MSSTTYTDFQGPAVNAAWLNDVNKVTYTSAPQIQRNASGQSTGALVDPVNQQAIFIRKPYFINPQLALPPLSSDAPTVTTLGPGGQPSQGASNYNSYAYNAGAVSLLGNLPVAVPNGLGSTFYQNYANSVGGSGCSPWAMEFDYFGSQIDVSFRNAAGGQSFFWVWVDDKPCTAIPVVSSANAANNQFWLALTWAGQSISSMTASGSTVTVTTGSAHGLADGAVVAISGCTPAAYNGSYAVVVTGTTTFTYTAASAPGTNTVIGSYTQCPAHGRRIRIYVSGADYGGLATAKTDSVFPTFVPSYSIAFVGDSYVMASSGTDQTADNNSGFATLVQRMLGVNMFNCGVPGTGYVIGSVTYGAAARIAELALIQPNEVWFFGSINDASATPAQVSTAATAAWAATKAACPNAIIRVFGVQTNTGSPSAANIANNTALASAAAAAGYTFIDMINGQWVTGTGSMSAPTGSGNADIMISPENIHPSQTGYAYYARKIVDAISNLITL